MKDTLIEWCDDTDNIVDGCDEAAPECANCYARDVAVRFSGYSPKRDEAGEILRDGDAKPVPDLNLPLHYNGLATRSPKRLLPQWTGVVRLYPELLAQRTFALFNTPQMRRIFWVSMGDIMHPEVPDGFLDQAFGAAAVTGEHVRIVVTKRPDRAADYTNGADVERRVRAAAEEWWGRLGKRHRRARETRFEWPGWPLPNIHLLCSAGCQETADKFLPHLVRAQAAVRGVSCEPFIGPTRFDPWLESLDWMIIGGESGGKARNCEEDWMLNVVRAARAARRNRRRAPMLFVKQMGRIMAKRLGMTLEPDPEAKDPTFRAPDTKGKNFSLFHSELQVREFPDPQPSARAA